MTELDSIPPSDMSPAVCINATAGVIAIVLTTFFLLYCENHKIHVIGF